MNCQYLNDYTLKYQLLEKKEYIFKLWFDKDSERQNLSFLDDAIRFSRDFLDQPTLCFTCTLSFGYVVNAHQLATVFTEFQKTSQLFIFIKNLNDQTYIKVPIMVIGIPFFYGFCLLNHGILFDIIYQNFFHLEKKRFWITHSQGKPLLLKQEIL